MTTVYLRETQENLPGTHVLIIGIGDYPHLEGGRGKLLNEAMGLGQLSSPPVSAKALCDWFLGRTQNASSHVGFNNPAAPLASIELLLSPREENVSFSNDTVSIESATHDNIKSGFQSWFNRLKVCDDSVGVFYFCGHGLMERSIMLPEDFGEDELDPWRSAIDLSDTVRALERHIQGPLYFFIDACRSASTTLLSSIIGTPRPLIVSKADPVLNKSRLLLQAAAETQSAYARPGQVSRFTGALIQSLSGFAGRKVPEENLWEVRGDDIFTSVNHLLSIDKLSGLRQKAEAKITNPTTFHVETVPTREYIELNISLWELQRDERFGEKDIPLPSPPERLETKSAIPEKDGVKVFISCSDGDLQHGNRLYDDLESKGQQPWMAHKSLIAGQNWKEATIEALESSDLFIALLSTQSIKSSGSFQKELKDAISFMQEMPSSAVFIIPARIDECKPPQQALRELFWVDLFPKYDVGVEKIFRAIEHVYSQSPGH